MRRRDLVIALALVVAFAVVTPTLGSQAMKGASFANQNSKAAKRIARLAKGIAQKANRKANSNRRAIRTFDTDLSGIEGQVNDLNGKVNTLDGKVTDLNGEVTATDGRVTGVEAELAASKAKTATEAATVTTANETDFVDLGGPSVTLTVPESGLIEVWIEATISDGALSLYEDGQQVPDQDPNGICDGPPGTLINFPSTPGFVTGTPSVASLIGCGSSGAPAPVLFKTTPGQHTYEVRYADCGCDPSDSEFSDRTLTVAPKP